MSEVLKECPERILEIYTCQKPSDSLYRELTEKGYKVEEVPKKRLSEMVQSESHQSFVAKVKNRHLVDVKEFLEEDHELVLLLDSIFDPQNLGAILRAAECFGVDLVVLSKNRGSDITPVVTKASVGASELVPISIVSNLAETMKAFQEGGYWAYAANVSDKSQRLDQTQFPEKTLLILGSEGRGVQPLLLKKCDQEVFIPMLGKIDSLNVSQATAVLLNSIRNG